MLSTARVSATIPVVDIDRAKKFYSETLGLTLKETDELGGAIVLAGDGTDLYLFHRAPTKADHTVAGFLVDDIEAEVADLQAKGLTFEEIVLGPLKTVNGIATIGNQKAAWLKDTEGNILGLSQRG